MNTITELDGAFIKDKEKLVAALFKPVRVVVTGPFDEAMSSKFRDEMSEALNSPQDTIPVVIDSYGGHVYSLLSMWDTIQQAKKHKCVVTIVSGKACSCGAALFSAGDLRYIGPEAEVMIHEVSSVNWGKNVEIQADAEHLKKLNDRLLTRMSLNIGKAPKFLAEKNHERGHTDWWIEAKEALELGLATHIAIPEMTLNVRVEFKLK